MGSTNSPLFITGDADLRDATSWFQEFTLVQEEEIVEVTVKSGLEWSKEVSAHGDFSPIVTTLVASSCSQLKLLSFHTRSTSLLVKGGGRTYSPLVDVHIRARM